MKFNFRLYYAYLIYFILCYKQTFEPTTINLFLFCLSVHWNLINWNLRAILQTAVFFCVLCIFI